MKVFAIEITANGIAYNFHTTSVEQLRKLFADTYKTGTLGAFTIWADNEKLDRMTQARLAFGTLPFEYNN